MGMQRIRRVPRRRGQTEFLDELIAPDRVTVPGRDDGHDATQYLAVDRYSNSVGDKGQRPEELNLDIHLAPVSEIKHRTRLTPPSPNRTRY